MKKTALAFCTCLLAVAAAAQSTCETRVDAHQHATTGQRVAYCLTPTYDKIYNNPGVVFSGVTQRHPETAQPEPRPTARNGSFRQEDVAVNQNFVETRQFPKLTDGRVSEQEIWEQRRAVYQGQQLAQQVIDETACEPQEEAPRAQQAVVKETVAGLRARQKKPGRRLQMLQETVTDTAVYTAAEPETAQEVVPMAAEYTYDEYADGLNAQPYAPAVPQAQDYVPVTQDAQPYEPYTSAADEIAVGTSSYAPAN